jgi:hypothetical protein
MPRAEIEIRAIDLCFFIRAFDAGSANFHSLAVNSHILQIYLLRALGSNVGMASLLR